MLVSHCRMIRNVCVPMSHDKKFQNSVRRMLSRVCHSVALYFTAVDCANFYLCIPLVSVVLLVSKLSSAGLYFSLNS